MNNMLKFTITKKSAEQEINRLSKTIGQSYDFSAAAWAIQRLIDAYEKDFNEKFPDDELGTLGGIGDSRYEDDYLDDVDETNYNPYMGQDEPPECIE